MNKPSVTQLIDLLDKPGLLLWANKQGLLGNDIADVRRVAKAAGTSMHDQIERGEFLNPHHADNHARFMRNVAVVSREQTIETEWFIGRYDAVLMCRGVKALVDYKASSNHRVYLEHKLQLAAYGMAVEADKFGIVATPDFIFVDANIAPHRKTYEGIMIALAKVWTLKQELTA